jgi:hypothetical protein
VVFPRAQSASAPIRHGRPTTTMEAQTKEAPMLDFTDGSTWFFAGFGTTVAVLLVLLAVVAVARLDARHR